MDSKDLMEMIDELRGRLEDEKLKRYHLHAEVIRLRREVEEHKKVDEIELSGGT